MVRQFYEGAVNSTEEHCNQFSFKIACHVFDEYFLVSSSLCWHQPICVRYFRYVPAFDLLTSASVCTASSLSTDLCTQTS